MGENKKRSLLQFIRPLASMKLTVIALLFMAVLVSGGTVYQASHGLYAAQEEIFSSWIIWLFGILPLPGLLLMATVLFLNLLAAVVFRLKYRWRQSGLLLIHYGLLLLVGGGFFIAVTSQEYFLTLRKGESSHLADSSRDWEIAVWTRNGSSGQERTVDSASWKPRQEINLPGLDLTIGLEAYYPNCQVVAGSKPGQRQLQSIPAAADPAENTPGLRLHVRDQGLDSEAFSLFGGDSVPAVLLTGNQTVHFFLRLKKTPLPIVIKLLDFIKTMHLGTDIPSSFTSRIEITSNRTSHLAVISMNRPLRYREYTFYQSSYREDGMGGKSSTFSVVRNSGRLLPYIASALIFLGLAVHFLVMLAVALKMDRS